MPPRSEEGSRDEIPCQGLGDEIPNVTQSKKKARIGEGPKPAATMRVSRAPKATITIPLYFLSVVFIERVTCSVNEKRTDEVYRKLNCRLMAPLSFLFIQRFAHGNVGLPPKPAWGHCPQTHSSLRGGFKIP